MLIGWGFLHSDTNVGLDMMLCLHCGIYSWLYWLGEREVTLWHQKIWLEDSVVARFNCDWQQSSTGYNFFLKPAPSSSFPFSCVISVTFRPIKHFGNLRKWLLRLGCKQDGRASLMGWGCTRNHPFKNHPFKNQLRRPVSAINFYLSKSNGSLERWTISVFFKSCWWSFRLQSDFVLLPFGKIFLEVFFFLFVSFSLSILHFEWQKESVASHLHCAVLTRAQRINQVQLSWD